MTFNWQEDAIWLLLTGLGLLGLLFLAWRSWPRIPSERRVAFAAFGLRCLALAAIALAIANPRWIRQRPTPGANSVALIVDNSEGMQLQDPGASASRGEQVRQALVGEDSGWLQTMTQSYPARGYQFDRKLVRQTDFRSLTFDGDRTNLIAALEGLRERLAGDPPIAVVLFTDGVASDSAGFSDTQLAGLPPIFPVAVGRDAPLPDVALREVASTESAFEDAPLQVRGSVSVSGFSAQGLTLSLRELGVGDDEPAISERIPIASSSEPASFRLDWPARSSGLRFFEVAAEAERSEDGAVSMNEVTDRNNRRLLISHVGQKRYRILYVAGRPNWEYKFLNRALADDPQIELVGLVRVANREPEFDFKGRSGESSNPLYRGFGREDETERYDEPVLVRLNTRDEAELRGGFPKTAEALFEYDGIILDDVEAGFFSYSQQGLLRDFVSIRGGGILALGGAGSLDDGDYGRSALAAALPVVFDANRAPDPVDIPAVMHLTREGWVTSWLRLRSVESDEQTRMNRMPAFAVINALPRLKPAAQILAVAESLQGDQYPALVTQPFGSGRVACLAIGDMWRWGMQDPAQREDMEAFWRQVSRWLVSDTPARVELQIDSRSDSGIRLLATAKGKDFKPLETGNARVQIERIDVLDTPSADDRFSAAEFGLTPVAGRAGQFEASIPMLDEGAYRATVTVTAPDGAVVGTAENGWITQPSVSEFASLNPDRALLQKIAEATGGKALEFSDLPQFEKLLSSLPAQRMETVSEPFWHRSSVFLVAAACLLGEWTIRRRRGLA